MISFNGHEKRNYSIWGRQQRSGLERSPEAKGKGLRGKLNYFSTFGFEVPHRV